MAVSAVNSLKTFVKCYASRRSVERIASLRHLESKLAVVGYSQRLPALCDSNPLPYRYCADSGWSGFNKDAAPAGWIVFGVTTAANVAEWALVKWLLHRRPTLVAGDTIWVLIALVLLLTALIRLECHIPDGPWTAPYTRWPSSRTAVARSRSMAWLNRSIADLILLDEKLAGRVAADRTPGNCTLGILAKAA